MHNLAMFPSNIVGLMAESKSSGRRITSALYFIKTSLIWSQAESLADTIALTGLLLQVFVRQEEKMME